MTRDAALENQKVMLAYAQGEKIQYKFKLKDDDDWRYAHNPEFNFHTCYYRVKPEYVPFTWDDREFIRGRFIKSKTTGNEFLIIAIMAEGVHTHEEFITYAQVFEAYDFIDGSPCGKLVE